MRDEGWGMGAIILHPHPSSERAPVKSLPMYQLYVWIRANGSVQAGGFPFQTVVNQRSQRQLA